MAVITVLGAGVMGTALTYPAADNDNDLRLVGTHLDDDIIQSCKEHRIHPRLKRRIHDNVKPYFYREIADAMVDTEIIVLGVNSRGVHWATQALAPYLRPGHIILMVTKGIESNEDELTILPDVLRANLPSGIRDQIDYAAIGGPSIAGELAARHHTNVVFVSRNPDILPNLQRLFATPYYHIWSSTDMIGIEVCVALKNPIALAVGLAAGLLERKNKEEGPDPANAHMHNYAAAIFAQGLAETAYIVNLMGGRPETVFSLPGAGDLYVTTQGGRNSRMGRLLGMGLSYSDAVEEMPGETIEGIDATIALMPAIEKMIESGKIDASALPLLRALHYMLTRNTPINFDFDTFFASLSMFNPPVTKA
ncbi:MAG: glycerol-3-phosphate dehydrogenase [Anaerolineae bacterium]|nr:glycerol-3-phosphate dehydrogenase [Anaerolineae bacterium]